MINSYNDSFVKKFNNEDNVKSYNDAFINASNEGEENIEYNNFFASANEDDYVGNQYKNPFITNKDTQHPGIGYSSSMKNFNEKEKSYSNNAFNSNYENSYDNKNNMTDNYFNNGNFTDDNYNAPFGTAEDKNEGRFIRSFMKGVNEDANFNIQPKDDFIVRNEEIDKELSLNNNNFTSSDNNETFGYNGINRNNEHRKDLNNNPKDIDFTTYNNINIPNVEESKLSYSDAFASGNEDNMVEQKNNNFDNSTMSNKDYGNLDYTLPIEVNAIGESINGLYSKHFGNDIDIESSSSEFSPKEVEDKKVDFTKLFKEEDKIEKTNNMDFDREYMNKLLKKYREEDNYKEGYLRNNYTYNNNRYFFNKFFGKDLESKNEANDYENNGYQRYNENNYDKDNESSWYNPYTVEQRRANKEFFSRYFNQSREEEDLKDNKDEEVEEKEEVLKDKNSSVPYNSYSYDNRNTVDYLSNYSIDENEDRRNKINYPQNSNEDFNTVRNFNEEINNQTYSTNKHSDLMQLNNRIDNVKEQQYLSLRGYGDNLVRGNFNVLSVDANNDTIKFPSTGVYKIDVSIDYNFIVTEYLAGKDYQLVFTLEDDSKNSVVVMNKVAPTSRNSSYIADTIKNNQLIEVTKLPYNLRVKLNNFSFINSSPLNINAVSISVIKVSN